ncbi:MAG: SH3 domain-containing protein [Thiothrix sp.]|nr:MAG: SH3 domain-containing protein [Thiothrix sp.]
MKLRQTLRTVALASAMALAAVVPAQAATQFMQVVNVSSNDVLNMRAGPNSNSDVIGSIPYNGQTVVATGNKQGSWIEVSWAGQTGWVNQRFLKAAVQQANSNRANRQTRQQQRPNRQTRPATRNESVSHTHPANECTRSITHSHPNGGVMHNHNYSCQPGLNTSGVKPKFAPKYQQMDVQLQY